MTTESSFLEIIAESLELDFQLNIDDRFKEYEEWDSMTFLSLMMLLRDEYGLTLEIDEFNQIETWKDVYNRITA
jgi:acyl carrier protein